ncbi:hypothetical protein OG568_56440 (plasmid) [Streptomyces sp. NBC_01450]|uniref:hypothetical protein n=1 Tax=Streptomyces sp. NBC_01450 TaxID=2903871 RepID=UPI002E2FCEE2|nr:hypothetical protein [Streptomyces sp. NBC_01450]
MHALSTHDQRHLLLDDLDHSRATLLVRRTGKPLHTVYLDELTYRLARQWLAERHRRWHATTSPYLLVTAHTATGPTACAWTASSTRPSTPTTPSTSSASLPAPP